MPNKIPKQFWPYFWETDPAKLNPDKNSLLIIQRLLDWNNFSAAKWVVNSYPIEKIKESLVNLRGWSKRSANFWANYFGIPKTKVLCLHPESPNQRVSHWES